MCVRRQEITRKRYTSEQIIHKLREAEVEWAAGNSEQTYYRWRKQYGGLRINQAKRLKDLERENSRLKRLVAELHLDKAILQEGLRGNF